MSESQSRGQAAAARLESLVEEMLSEAGQLPTEILTWQPAEGVWSAMDVLCHVQEFIHYWTQQTADVVRHPERPWGRDHTDENRLAAVSNTAARSFVDVQRAIRQEARDAADVLRRMSDVDLSVESASRNPRWGVKPAHFIVDQLLVQHVEKHLGQIRRNVSQYRGGGQSIA